MYIKREEIKNCIKNWYESMGVDTHGVWNKQLVEIVKEKDDDELCLCFHDLLTSIEELPSADAVQDWIIGKPTEQGKYMVTIDSFGHKHIDLFYYGKPMTPNRKVRGKCWYRSDDEWGDVVYDDTDILAWQPLPQPYKESEVEE